MFSNLFNAHVNAVETTKPPIKIFIAAGQSNMEGPGNSEEIEKIAPDLLNPRDDVWCIYAGRYSGWLEPRFGFRSGNFGPELKFGHMIGDHLDNEVVIIKSAIGGTRLHSDWRPPSAVAQRGGQVGPLYLDMIRRVHNLLKDPKAFYPDYEGQGFELAGLLWLQGETDACDPVEGLEYEANLIDFIADFRSDLGVDDLPIIIAQINDSDCWDDGDKQGPYIRATQKKVAESDPYAAWFITSDLDPGFHYDSPSHVVIGQRFAEATIPLLRETTVNHAKGSAIADAAQLFYEREFKDSAPDTASLAQGLIGYWPLDEAAGSATKDVSGKGADGTLQNGAAWKPGLIGSAIRLADQQSVVFSQFKDPVNADGDIESMSFSYWVQTPLKFGNKMLSKSGTRPRDAEEVATGWFFTNPSNEGWSAFDFDAPEEEQRLGATWGDPLYCGDGLEWHHVACVWVGKQKTMSMFVDNRPIFQNPLELTGSTIGSDHDAVLTLGGELPKPSYAKGHFHAFDEIAIWDRPLSQEEVTKLYNNGCGVSLKSK